MYLTPTNSHWACDIEADGYLEDATRIWCVCVENILTGEKHEFTEREAFLEWLQDGYILVGHNFIAYDLPMLNRHWRVGIGVRRCVDSFLLSQLYNPSLSGGHSLEAWGKRLGYEKGEHNDFTQYSPEMLHYCGRDTHLTRLLYRKLSSRMVSVGFTESGCEIEHLSWNIIQNKQKRYGFPFNKQRAEELLASLLHRKEQLENEIYSLWPPELMVVGTYRKAFKADGSYSKQYERHVQQYPVTEVLNDGTYRVSDYVPFNIGSSKQRVEKLLALGWTPVKFTKKTPKGGGGNPKTDEESLRNFADVTGNTQVLAIAKWVVVNSRITQNLRPWLNAYNEKTGAIHGSLFLANTLRYRHSNPNTANIPAVRKKKDEVTKVEHILYGEDGAYAYECRDLFTCGDPSAYRLVGVDAKGIQIRILLNYAYSKEAFELYTTGDPHVNNAELLGLANKAAAKKFFYTLIMGGLGKRLALDQAQFGTKMTADEGEEKRLQMIESIPGFNDLISRLARERGKTGRIKLCDGTPVLVTEDRKCISHLLQGDESRIMKKASIWLDEEIRREKLPAFKVCDVHDEWQFVVRHDAVARFMEVALAVFPRVGKFFNYVVPIEGDAKEGLTWAETH